jgi:transposase
MAFYAGYSKIANGLIEGINSLVRAAKAKARGYRSIRNLTAMVKAIPRARRLSG